MTPSSSPRAGAVWACFLDGKPATTLGSEEEFWKAVTTFYDERHPKESPAPPQRRRSNHRRRIHRSSPARQMGEWRGATMF